MPYITLPSVEDTRHSTPDEEGRVEINAQDVLNLEVISSLLQQTETMWNKLSVAAKEALADFHIENHDVNHCIAHGSQNIQEVVSAISWKKKQRVTDWEEYVTNERIYDLLLSLKPNESIDAKGMARHFDVPQQFLAIGYRLVQMKKDGLAESDDGVWWVAGPNLPRRLQ